MVAPASVERQHPAAEKGSRAEQERKWFWSSNEDDVMREKMRALERLLMEELKERAASAGVRKREREFKLPTFSLLSLIVFPLF